MSTERKYQVKFDWELESLAQAALAALADKGTGRITITRVHDEYVMDIETRDQCENDFLPSRQFSPYPDLF